MAASQDTATLFFQKNHDILRSTIVIFHKSYSPEGRFSQRGYPGLYSHFQAAALLALQAGPRQTFRPGV